MPSEADTSRDDLRPFVVRTAIVVGIVLAATALSGMLVLLADLVVLTFGAILLATALRHGGGWIAKRTGLSNFWGFIVLTAALFLAGGLLCAFLGPYLYQQFKAFSPKFLEAVTELQTRFEGMRWSEEILRRLRESDLNPSKLFGSGFIAQAVGSVWSTATGAFLALLVVFGASLFIAFDPDRYREPIVRLFPANRRTRIRDVLDDTGDVLARWFLGRLVSMVFNGGLIAIYLWWAGVPMPWLLGLIAGLMSFVPLIGSWLAIVPAVIFAAPLGVDAMIWVIVVYTIIQHIENLIITPIVMQKAVDIPPAYVLLSQLALGALVGTVGVAFAVPLLAAVTVIVRRLYVQDVLGERSKKQREADARLKTS